MDHIILPANTPCLPFLRKRSPDGATPNWGKRQQLQLTTHLSTLNGWKAGWLTYSGLFTHISGHPSATGRVQDRESAPAKDWRSTTVPQNQPECLTHNCLKCGTNTSMHNQPFSRSVLVSWWSIKGFYIMDADRSTQWTVTKHWKQKVWQQIPWRQVQVRQSKLDDYQCLVVWQCVSPLPIHTSAGMPAGDTYMQHVHYSSF